MEVRPGYKQTDVGVIPENWDVTTFGELFAFTNGVNADKTAYGKGVRFINVLEPISYSHIYGPEIPGRVEISGSVASAYSVRPGDIVFNRTSETDSELGLAAVYLGDEQVVFGGFVIRGRPIDDALDPKYSGYALRAKMIRSQIIPMGQGAVRANIGQQNLRRVLVAVPPKPEQRAIAAALSDVDALLGGLDRLIAKKRDLKQAAMQQLLTGQTRLPGYHGAWEAKRFEDVLCRVNAKAFQVQTLEYESTGKHPVVDQGKQIVVGYSDRDDKCFRCPNGGVIVFGDHTCIVKFIDFNFLVGADGTQLLHGRSGQSTRFHAYQLQFRGVEPTGYNRHFKFLRERAFVAPSEHEQAAIAAVLSDMDAELSALEARRDKTRALKQAMMQQLLTGKTRLV